MGQSESTTYCGSSRRLKASDDDDFSVQVTINDVVYRVTNVTPMHTSLNSFIRNVAKLKGTKAMCHEGGCGACIVAAEIDGKVISVNSCLVPIFICHGWKITTIEGLGDRKNGYHTLQATLADMNGSQCGFCSPGWVMSMYRCGHSSILRWSMERQLTMSEIENSFAANICRCTGYRPILDAFKSFGSDAPPMMQKQIKDIEDLYGIKSCNNCPRDVCTGTCSDLEIIYESAIPRPLELNLPNSVNFYKVLQISEIFSIFEKHPEASYIIHGGNTAHGVYRTQEVQLYIDVNSVPNLHRIESKGDSVTFGANVTLNVLKDTLIKHMKQPGFAHFKTMAKHIDLVASIPIRNIGTVAGNLMIKHNHREFASDIFLLLETAGAQIHILDSPGSKTSLSMLEFLEVKMDKKLIYSIVLPNMGKDYCYETYKIMPRSQNAHAIVNAGFFFKLNKAGKVLEKPNIIFGGINPDFYHASKTEQFLIGKSIYDNKSLKQALNTLNSELNPDYVLPDYKPEYRKLLAASLLYKFVLSINPSKVQPKFRSGGSLLHRELSSGRQDYDTDRNMWPVNQPVPKVGAIYQTSGEAEYIYDLIVRDNEVFCALTFASAPGMIKKIDYQDALDMEGVIAFLTAKDIPGINAFINKSQKVSVVLTENEVLFAEKEITYSGQAYGMIIAENHDLAQYAASKVNLVYTKGPKRKPMITVHDVIASNDKARIIKQVEQPAIEPAGKNGAYKIEGTYECGSQYHFAMETINCACVPLEDGMDVFVSTQWMELTQTSIAAVLGVPINRLAPIDNSQFRFPSRFEFLVVEPGFSASTYCLNLKVRRLGGSYGIKFIRSTQIACACALACHTLNRPARLVLTAEDSMRSIGKRKPTYLEYSLSVDENGKIQELNATFWSNVGTSVNDTNFFITIGHFYNCYDYSTWAVVGNDVKTDTPTNTYCRAPGSTEGVAMIEQIMERIARVTGKDPVEVRMANMLAEDKETMGSMIDELKRTSDYEKRVKDIYKFNSENRWKKRGMSLVPMKFPISFFERMPYHSLVSIYARDGTVSITCGGIEMGQGLHTKVAQIAAYTLGIDLNMVSVKPSSTLTSPNDFFTANSFGSDTCGYATQMACKELLKRLQPIKDILGGNPSWKQLVLKAFEMHVDLCATFMFTNKQDIKSYSIYGVTVSEVEVDMLTGQHLIRRVDILEDTGISLSPKIDVGQIEGAFVMGIGYWTSEDLLYDPETGSLTNYRTWNYKVPGAKDIPVDFRISFRRNAPNPFGVLRSKATSEPPLCMSFSVPLAIRQALNAARADAGNTDPWYQLDNAHTVERILMNSLTNVDAMTL